MKKLFFLILLGLLAYFVWPTRYQHYAAGASPHAAEVTEDISSAPTRVDRLTGDISIQEASGPWRTIGNARKALVFQRPVVDPNATRRPSLQQRDELSDKHHRSVQQTQNAVQAATQD